MRKNETPVRPAESLDPRWGSDIAAMMLRALGIKYVAINPGASYRGLHDSLVNFLGNQDPRMLLCLHEDHVVSIAHGYAKATGEPMGAILHSNVGLMHGLMGIFNAFCDRVPMLILGATGPVEAQKRRPWIDWIHTAKDQGALLRNYTKWDDEPRSPEAVIESFLRGMQATVSEPKAPVYICLDAGLQEQTLDRKPRLPDVSRYTPAPAASPSPDSIKAVVDLLAEAKNPLLLIGRGSVKREAWERRVRLAELSGASVLTSIRERACFPTDHPLCAATPFFWASARAKEVVRAADAIVSLDWPDLNGFLQQISDHPETVNARIAHVSLDHQLHNGWSMDYFGLPPVDIPIAASPDALVQQLLPVLERRFENKPRWKGESRNPERQLAYSADSSASVAPRDIEVALAKLRGERKITLAHVTLGWAGDAYHFGEPLDYLGHDGGAGIGAGPGLTVGAALALKESGRTVVSVLGDGDFLQGVTALWTAAHYGIPALFIVSNNRSNFNDEIHQETVAKARNRPVENRWIGQRIDDPAVDLAAIARAQGVRAEGPVSNVTELEEAILRGLACVAAGESYLVDVVVKPGYANPPLSRGK